MQPINHLLAGWCAANLVEISAEERALCMLAAVSADLDGAGILFGREAYLEYHHILTHNFIAAGAVALLAAMLAKHRRRVFFLSLAIFHLHLLMDFFGSGVGWGISYFWPIYHHSFRTAYAWDFQSRQNALFFLIVFSWTIWIAVRKKRHPFELVLAKFTAETQSR